jgi:enoyl-[acyl-carrier protein] reductase I
MGLMRGKRGIIFGVANDMSIAWGIAQKLKEEGAELAFTYLNEALEKRVRPLAESLGSTLILPCDVASDAEIEAVFSTLKQEWGTIDFVVHAVAFANREDLKHPFSQTSRDGFKLALDISAYSLVAVTRCRTADAERRQHHHPIYPGATRAVPNYNVMAWRRRLRGRDALLAAELGERESGQRHSAGPIRTLAASACQLQGEDRPDGRHARCALSLRGSGKSSVYFSDLSSGVTGEVHCRCRLQLRGFAG